MTMTTKTPLHLFNKARRLQAILGWVTIGLLAGAALALLLLVYAGPGASEAVRAPLIIASLLMGIVGVAMPIGYLIARGEARRIAQLIENFAEGKFLVRWSYTPELWQQYRRVEERAALFTFREFLWVFGIAYVLVMGVFTYLYLRNHGRPRGISDTAFVIIGGGITAFMGLLLLIVRLVQQSRARRSSREPQDAIVSRRGAFCDNQFILWGTAGRRLGGVELVMREGIYVLEFTILVNDNPLIQRVPVPPGSESLAKKVARAILEDPTAKEGGEAGIVQDVAHIVQGM